MQTTTRLVLDVPESTDQVSAYPADAAQSLAVLDGAVLIAEGALASRPTTGLVYGQTYYATDLHGGCWTFYNGSAWEIVQAAGAWQSLSLTSGITALSGDYSPPSARIVGDRVEMKGAITNTSGSSFAAAATLFTLPASAMYPTATALVGTQATGGGVCSAFTLAITSSGVGQVGGTGPALGTNNNIVPLDGLSYPLA